MAPLLRLEHVTRHFGGVRAVDDINLEIPEGEIFGLIGPNGAGKTTLVNLTTGYLGLDRGEIWLGDRRLDGTPAHGIASQGVARTFQSIRLYKDLTATENVLVGMHSRRRHDTLQQLALLPAFRRGQRRRVGEAQELLAKVGLDPSHFGDRRARTLSYGDQRRLEVARALALHPRLLILDEPAAGMNPSEKERIRELIEAMNADGLTVLLIDHDMRLVMGVCRQIAVLNFGSKIADGTPAAVSADERVVVAYLGSEAARQGRRHVPGSGGLAAEVSAVVDATAVVPEPDHGELLVVRELTVRYGAVTAVEDASLHVADGEVVALIGANGAGKSTILNTLSGVIRPAAGSAVFEGLDLASAPPHRIVSKGMIQVPEGREILARLTVIENLQLGTWSRRDRASARRQIDELMERFPILAQRAGLPAGQLSGGEQQILAIARGLLGRPRLLLLDEPSLGLAPQLVDQVFEMIESIHSDGMTVLLVEQNAMRALQVADRAYVIEAGKIRITGTGDELLRNSEVKRAYLGG
jgi:ABC-type branched-subunit amino acid transport system ATPase component